MKTQEAKLVFLCAVPEEKPIGLWEMVKEDGGKFKTLGGKQAKGITAAYCPEFFKNIKTAARRVLGPGPIGIWLDNAKVHTACKELLEQLFDEVVFQPPSSPDTNHCDAGCFAHMGNMVHAASPKTKGDICAAVAAAWKQITLALLQRTSARVRRNMAIIKNSRGATGTKRGNFKCPRDSRASLSRVFIGAFTLLNTRKANGAEFRVHR
jgi:hypothetical protein